LAIDFDIKVNDPEDVTEIEMVQIDSADFDWAALAGKRLLLDCLSLCSAKVQRPPPIAFLAEVKLITNR